MKKCGEQSLGFKLEAHAWLVKVWVVHHLFLRIPNSESWFPTNYVSVKIFKTTNRPSDWSNNFVKIQDYSELEIRENMWWTDSVVHQKSCEHRLFQLLSKHYFKRFKTRLLLHPSSVAQNHSPYWWCHIPKRKNLEKKKTLKGKLFSYQP